MSRPHIGVVVPVHDEAQLLDRCLAGLAEAVRRAGSGIEVGIVVVLDRCTDASAEIARRWPVTTTTISAGVVGVARATGCALALDRGADWLACTDADSVVPPEWLLAHRDAHADGCDALTGTVRLADTDTDTDTDTGGHAARPGRVLAGYAAGSARGHPHVHGANLGVRASVYRALGGFAPLPTGEDVALVEQLERSGAVIRRTSALAVTTSARRVARAPDGFAARLAAVEALQP